MFNFNLFATESETSIQSDTDCQICVGDRVIESYFQYGPHRPCIGTVQMVSTNGKAQVKFDDLEHFYTLDVQYLSKSVSCADNICVGDRFIESYFCENCYQGTVGMIFKNGLSRVILDNRIDHPFIIPVNKLSKEVSCFDGFCKKDSVMAEYFGNYIPGTIERVFSNRQAEVMMQGYKASRIMAIKNLSKCSDCYQR